MIFRVQLDNEPTVGNLLGVTAAGNGATPCGMLQYSSLTDEVDINYVATQPWNHLNWNLTVSKGIHQPTSEQLSVHASESSPPFVLPTTGKVPNQKGSYNNTAGDLLRSCSVEGAAAFGVSLVCIGTATNGYTNVYSSSDSISFALLKKPPKTA